MKLLITGGAGFLGLHTTWGFWKRGYDIKIIDIAPINPQEYPPDVEYIRGDIRDPLKMKEAVRGVDIIIHAAAALPLWKEKEIWSVNVDGTKNVLKQAYKENIERVIFISSTSVYGIPNHNRPEKEDDPLNGVGPYGKSKIAAEKICNEYRKMGMTVPILRPKTFIGPGRLGIFSLLFEWIKDGVRIPIIGDGKNRYQLLDVEDLVQAEILVAEKEDELVNDVFNVGAKEFRTWNEDLGDLIKYARTGSKIVHIPAWIAKPVLAMLSSLRLIPFYEWAYGTADKEHYVSTEKIETRLGWKPRYSNIDSLIRSYDWFVDHYEEIKNSAGVTHRTIWRQGLLRIVKALMGLKLCV